MSAGTLEQGTQEELQETCTEGRQGVRGEGGGSDTQSSLQTKSCVGDSYFVQGADSYCGDSLWILGAEKLLEVPTVLFSESQKICFKKMITNVPFIPGTIQLLTPERCIFGEFGPI